MEKGLVEAIEDLLQGSFEFTKIEYEFEHSNIDQRFDEKIEISLYRIVQEAIQNIQKHANATYFEVCINYENGIHLLIKDNGKGFDPNQVEGGFGLVGINERVRLLNGTLAIDSKANEGSQLEIKI